MQTGTERDAPGSGRPCLQAQHGGLSRRQAGPRAVTPDGGRTPSCHGSQSVKPCHSSRKRVQWSDQRGHRAQDTNQTWGWAEYAKKPKHGYALPARPAAPTPAPARLSGLHHPRGPGVSAPTATLPHPAQAGTGARPHGPAAPRSPCRETRSPKTCLTPGGFTPDMGLSLTHSGNRGPPWRKHLETAWEGASVGPPAWRSLGPSRWEPCVWALPLGRAPRFPRVFTASESRVLLCLHGVSASPSPPPPPPHTGLLARP